MILALVYLAFKYLIHLLMPFVLALIFVMIMRPVVKFFINKLKVRSGLAAVVVMFLFFATIGSLLVLVMFRIIDAVGDLFTMLPTLYSNTIEPGLMNLLVRVQELGERFDLDILAAIESAGDEIVSAAGSAVSSVSGKVVTWVSGLAAKLPGAFISLLICVIATFFMAVDYTRMVKVILRILPERARDVVIGARRSLSKIIWQYTRSYAMILSITFVELSIGMLILGVRKPILVALLIAILDIFPIVGTGTALWPWTIISFIQGNVGRGLSLMAVYLVITVIRQIIEPKIVGQHVGLHPLITLICMFVGTSLFGGFGLFGLPILAAILLELNKNGTIRLFRTEDGGERIQAQPEDERAEDTPPPATE